MPTEGMLISDKYGPFITHDIEATDRRIRFITGEAGIHRFDGPGMIPSCLDPGDG